MKRVIETIYEDVLEGTDQSGQDKKTYLIGIVNEVTTIMPKLDNKQLNTPTLSKHNEDTDPDGKVKKNAKVVNGGDKNSDIQAVKAVADGDQKGDGKLNILRELGVSKKTSLLKK